MTPDTSRASQLTLPLSLVDKPGFQQFIVGENLETIELLHSIARGTRQTRLFLWGPTGCGISHLIQACCIMADERNLSVAYVPLDHSHQLEPALLENLENNSLVCIDDIDTIAGKLDWEKAIFHLYNRLRERQNSLIMGAHVNPRTVQFELADLKSRMVWDLVYRIKPLADIDKIEALQRRSHDRGFKLPREVAEYLVKRVKRDMPNLITLLDDLEKASLAEKRKLTIPFVRSFLENYHPA